MRIQSSDCVDQGWLCIWILFMLFILRQGRLLYLYKSYSYQYQMDQPGAAGQVPITVSVKREIKGNWGIQ
jgi:hypothetical protein